MAETGHARNVEHFATMISFVAGYGAVYNPNNRAILLPALQAKLAASNGVIDGVTTAMAPYRTKVNERENAYSGIRKLVTRVVNSYAASGAEENAIADVRSLKRKLIGARAKALPKARPGTPDEEIKRHSVSQLSHTQVAENFDSMIEQVSNDPLYAPNEKDLQVPQLQAKLAAMKAANTAVIEAAVPLSNARLVRNSELYEKKTGLVDIAGLVKKYVKSVFGADSAEYRQISGLKFYRSS